MDNIIFKSKWVEKCVRRVLNKPEGDFQAGEISKIKYIKAGGDFSGGTVLDLSTELPPEPFAAFDGGDEWSVCLHSDTNLGMEYRLEDYIKTSNGLWIDNFEIDEWEYAHSKKAKEAWNKFEKSIVKNNIFDDFTEEEINALEENLLPLEDLGLFTGIVVLRLYESEIYSTEWFKPFQKLRVLEMAETNIEKETACLEVFSGLKQLSIWCD